MLFITLQSLPSFLSFSTSHRFPRLKPRQVPLEQWGLQVLVLTAGSLLNNWVYAYKVPLTVQIVFRSGSTSHPSICIRRQSIKLSLGLAVSMLFGHLLLKKTYSHRQIVSWFFAIFCKSLTTSTGAVVIYHRRERWRYSCHSLKTVRKFKEC